MKVVSVFALTLATASAFQQVQPAFRSTTTSLRITKEEDLELTRKVIQDFEKAQSGEAPAPEPEAAKKEKEPVAAKEE